MKDRIEFGEQVRDLYSHLYDLVYLRTHPLTDELLSDASAPSKEKGWRLHDLLLDAIKELDPGPRAAPYSREWRRYRLMVGRYQNGQDPGAVMQEIAVSKRQFYREQEAALESVADLLWDHYVAQARAAPVTEDRSASDHIELLRLEAARSAQAGRYTQPSEVIRGALALLEERLRQRNLTLGAILPDTLPRVRADKAPLRQLLLGVIGYLVERAEHARLHVAAEIEDDALYVGVTIDPPAALRPAAPAEVAERLAAFEEMAGLTGGKLEAILAESGVIGFEIGLQMEVQRAVLVVDDNEDVLELCRRYLAPHGYGVITATTAEEAIGLAAQLQPFAITLDLMLPGQDGWDALQALLNRPDTRRIPVIICSVLKQRELALSLGATAFLEKPVTEQGLLAALRMLEAA
ncbi:MAG: response regulator [Anaerolineae bacterium]|nr:response regulator [Anaerolineae bacterium]